MIDAHRRPTLVFRAVIEMEPSAYNRVTLNKNNKDYFGNPGADLSLNFTQKDKSTIEEARKLLKRLASYMELEDVEYLDQIVDWGHHHVGTCRMGADPMTSVVDKNLKVHGTKNLYVTGSAVFVTNGASMPTLTISALSLRLADQLTKIKVNQ